MSIPKIEPIKIKEYEVKQSKYQFVGKLPIRSIILGFSGSGKSVLLQNMTVDIYNSCFNKIYIFSPSIDVGFWGLVDKYRKLYDVLTYR